MKVIFMHIPKSGGTTLYPVFPRFYDEQAIRRIRVVNQKLNTQEFINLPLAEKEKVALLCGHMQFGLHRHFPNEQAKYFTFLRKPSDRIVSHYYFLLRTPNHYLYEQVVQNKMSLLDYALSDLSIELDNGQVRSLTGQDTPLNQCDESLLNQAIENLQTHFIAWGIMERYDESLLLIKDKLNWSDYPFYKKLNVNQKRKAIDPEIIQQINQRNQWDIKLYEWALMKFEEQIQHMKNLETELKILQALNTSYAAGFQQASLNQEKTYRKGFHDGRIDGYNEMYRRFPHLKLAKNIKNALIGKKKN